METTSTIWMGLTMTCARCHTHKYDPITHKEYYGLFSFFNNLNEAVMDGNKPNPDPFIKLPSPEQTARQAELKKLLADGQKKIDAPMPELDKAQEGWEAKWREKLSAGWTILAATNASSTNGAQFKMLEDQSVLVEGPNPEKDVHELTITVAPGTLAALGSKPFPHESLPNKSAARADDGGFRLSEFEAELIPVPTSEAEENQVHPGARRLRARRATTPRKAIDGKPETGWQADPAANAEPHAILFLRGGPADYLDEHGSRRFACDYEASTSKRAIGHFRLAAAQNEQLVQLLAPPKPEPWQVIGPFKTETICRPA